MGILCRRRASRYRVFAAPFRRQVSSSRHDDAIAAMRIAAQMTPPSNSIESLRRQSRLMDASAAGRSRVDSLRRVLLDQGLARNTASRRPRVTAKYRWSLAGSHAISAHSRVANAGTKGAISGKRMSIIDAECAPARGARCRQPMISPPPLLSRRRHARHDCCF